MISSVIPTFMQKPLSLMLSFKTKERETNFHLSLYIFRSLFQLKAITMTSLEEWEFFVVKLRVIFYVVCVYLNVNITYTIHLNLNCTYTPISGQIISIEL